MVQGFCTHIGENKGLNSSLWASRACSILAQEWSESLLRELGPPAEPSWYIQLQSLFFYAAAWQRFHRREPLGCILSTGDHREITFSRESMTRKSPAQGWFGFNWDVSKAGHTELEVPRELRQDLSFPDPIAWILDSLTPLLFTFRLGSYLAWESGPHTWLSDAEAYYRTCSNSCSFLWTRQSTGHQKGRLFFEGPHLTVDLDQD